MIDSLSLGLGLIIGLVTAAATIFGILLYIKYVLAHAKKAEEPNITIVTAPGVSNQYLIYKLTSGKVDIDSLDTAYEIFDTEKQTVIGTIHLEENN